MRFTPKKDEELNSFDLFPKGEYDFAVIKSFDEVSKAGNTMIKLELDIYSENGGRTRIFDYILESIPHKLKHFCQTAGLEKEYETGDITADMCRNRTGRCLVVVKQDKSGEYPDKNEIKDYCKPEQNQEKQAEKKMNLDDINEEELPF